jgi:hypothetical protein
MEAYTNMVEDFMDMLMVLVILQWLNKKNTPPIKNITTDPWPCCDDPGDVLEGLDMKFVDPPQQLGPVKHVRQVKNIADFVALQ